jgi:peroxiredoxin
MASKKQRTMLSEGGVAPDFTLRDLDGAGQTRSGISHGHPLLLVFFKVSCPTCQYTLPFIERIYRGRTNREIGIYVISQDDAESTRAFHREFGITMPTMLDSDDDGYPASNAYGLSHVPSLFLIEPDGRISKTLTGFDRKGMQELGRRLGKEPFELGEYVPEWKAG